MAQIVTIFSSPASASVSSGICEAYRRQVFVSIELAVVPGGYECIGFVTQKKIGWIEMSNTPTRDNASLGLTLRRSDEGNRIKYDTVELGRSRQYSNDWLWWSVILSFAFTISALTSAAAENWRCIASVPDLILAYPSHIAMQQSVKGLRRGDNARSSISPHVVGLTVETNAQTGTRLRDVLPAGESTSSRLLRLTSHVILSENRICIICSYVTTNSAPMKLNRMWNPIR